MLSFSSIAFSEISFTFNSSDYYAVIGQDANIPVYVDNNYTQNINGQLTYTITETVVQQGFQSTSSNTQSQPFSVEKSANNLAIGFNLGTSNQEISRTMTSTFTYLNPDNGNSQTVTFPKITVHFVKDEKEKQEQQEQNKEEEQQSQTQQQQQQQPQVPNDQMQKQIQNNQQSQDSNALKKQMNNEIQKQQEKENALKNNISQDKNYQDALKDLENQGFTKKDEPKITPNEFNQDFENLNTGEKANISAKINNNSIEDIKSNFENSRLEQDIMNNSNKLNQELKKNIENLKNNGYNETPMMFSKENNITSFKKTLTNKDNKSVEFTGTLNDSTVINFDKTSDNGYNLLWLFFVLILIITSLIYYNKYFKKQDSPIEKTHPIIPIDYRKEAIKIINEAKKTFEKDKKTAYELLAYSLRYYYTNTKGSKTQISNSALKKMLQNENINLVLDAASVVEFAKGVSDKKTFDNYSNISLDFIKQ